MYPWMQKGCASSTKGLEKFSSVKKESIKKILVIRHAALGDMVQTRPFLYELRKLFPDAEITLSLASHYQYCAPIDLVDKVHVMYGQDMRNKSIFEKWKNIKEVGEFDLLFDLACTTRSHLLSFFTKARLKLAFPYKNWRWVYDLCLFRTDLNFEAQILLEFLYLFGHKPEFPINYCLPKHNIESSKKTIAYFISSSTLGRNYPQERYFELIKKLATQYKDHEHVLLQGRGEHEKYEKEFNQLSHLQNVSLKPTMQLEELISYLSEIRMLVANDTGVRHLALATHTPTLGLFHNSIPYRNWPRYENIHDCVLSYYDEHPSVEEVSKAFQNLFQKIYKA